MGGGAVLEGTSRAQGKGTRQVAGGHAAWATQGWAWVRGRPRGLRAPDGARLTWVVVASRALGGLGWVCLQSWSLRSWAEGLLGQRAVWVKDGPGGSGGPRGRVCTCAGPLGLPLPCTPAPG